MYVHPLLIPDMECAKIIYLPMNIPRIHHTIHADGGTPCNIPSRGYGIGYGSYSIDDHSPVRVNHGRPMSNNAAEIWTFCSALEHLLALYPSDSHLVKLVCQSDSRIALKWLQASNKPWRLVVASKKGSDEFHLGIARLRELTPKFSSLSTEWKARAFAMEKFGH